MGLMDALSRIASVTPGQGSMADQQLAAYFSPRASDTGIVGSPFSNVEDLVAKYKLLGQTLQPGLGGSLAGSILGKLVQEYTDTQFKPGGATLGQFIRGRFSA